MSLIFLYLHFILIISLDEIASALCTVLLEMLVPVFYVLPEEGKIVR